MFSDGQLALILVTLAIVGVALASLLAIVIASARRSAARRSMPARPTPSRADRVEAGPPVATLLRSLPEPVPNARPAAPTEATMSDAYVPPSISTPIPEDADEPRGQESGESADPSAATASVADEPADPSAATASVADEPAEGPAGGTGPAPAEDPDDALEPERVAVPVVSDSTHEPPPSAAPASAASAAAGPPAASDLAVASAPAEAPVPAEVRPTASPAARTNGTAPGDALVDPDTGLDTLLAWERMVAEESSRYARYRRPCSVVVAEIDGLARLDDRLGPEAVRRVLPAVGDTLRRQARRTDRVAHAGKGRFLVLMPETDEVQAINYIERVRASCDRWLETSAVNLRLSLGWASPSAVGEIPTALRTAEERMYEERRQHRRLVPAVDDRG